MHREKLAYRVVQILFAASALCIAAYNFFFDERIRTLLGLVALLFLLVPPVAERLLRLRLGYLIRIFVLLFCFFAYNLGTALRFYARFPMYDDIAHLISGILFTLIGLCFYARLRKSEVRFEDEWGLHITYALFFSLSIAVVWEIYEFLLFVIVGHDAQHHLTTGVFDTMEDIIACAIGSLVMAASYLLYVKRDFSLFLMRVYEDFVSLNPKQLK